MANTLGKVPRSVNLIQLESDVSALETLLVATALPVSEHHRKAMDLIHNIKGSLILLNIEAETQKPVAPPLPPPISDDKFRHQAITLVLAEMDRQDKKWGPQRKQHPFKWAAILTEEVGEVAQAALDQDRKGSYDLDHDEVLIEAVQVSAVAAQLVMARLFSTSEAKRIFKRDVFGPL